MSVGDAKLCSMLGLDPEDPYIPEAIRRCREYCESIGLDPNNAESVATVNRLRDLEWKISVLDPDRRGNIHAWGRALLEEGQEAADRFKAKQRAELHEVFAAFESITGCRHPEDDRPHPAAPGPQEAK